MHKHAKIIMEWAQMMQLPEAEWKLIQHKNKHEGYWTDCTDAPCFFNTLEYRWKPRTLRIGDYDVPEPVRETPEMLSNYYLANVLSGCVSPHSWCGDWSDKKWFKSGLVFDEKENAELMLKALLSLTQKKE